MDDMATEARVETAVGVRRSRRRGNEPFRSWAHRLTWGEWLAVAVGVAALVQVARARANFAPCAFLPLALPALMVVFSRSERLRALRGTRALWSSLGEFVSGGKTPW